MISPMVVASPDLRGGVRLSAGLFTRLRAFLRRVPAMSCYRTVCWRINAFVPYRSIGWNYCRDRLPLAGKPSFFCDRVVIKYGQMCYARDTPPAKSRDWPRCSILGDVTDHPERVARYFEDYVPGTTVDCGSFSMSEEEIIAFAKEYDPQPFHVDPVAAKDGPFGGLIASGWHTTSMMMRQLVPRYVSPESSLGAAGVDELRWRKPVRPGDTLHVRATVVEARRSSSKPDRGIVKTLMELTNQGGDMVMKVTAINFILLRPA